MTAVHLGARGCGVLILGFTVRTMISSPLPHVDFMIYTLILLSLASDVEAFSHPGRPTLPPRFIRPASFYSDTFHDRLQLVNVAASYLLN